MDAVETQVLYYDNAPPGPAILPSPTGRREASENVWGSPSPYLVPVDSSTDREADHFTYTVQFSTAQTEELLKGLGLAPDPSAPEGWFGVAALTPSGYGLPLPVCGQTITGPAPAQGAGAAERLFHGAVPERDVFFHHHGLRPRGRAEPVGAKALPRGQTAARSSPTTSPERNCENSKAAGHFCPAALLIESDIFSEADH